VFEETWHDTSLLGGLNNLNAETWRCRGAEKKILRLCVSALKKNCKNNLQVKNIVLYLQQFFVLLQSLFEMMNGY
jgi:hypothetical protein